MAPPAKRARSAGTAPAHSPLRWELLRTSTAVDHASTGAAGWRPPAEVAAEMRAALATTHDSTVHEIAATALGLAAVADSIRRRGKIMMPEGDEE